MRVGRTDNFQQLIKVRSELYIFQIIAIPLIIIATGAGVTFTQVGPFSSSCIEIEVDLIVLTSSLELVPNDHGTGPSG